jgi:putative YjhG/YagF family dehydratase
MELEAKSVGVNQILTDSAIRNAMAVHAAFGGSTNLLLHIPAIAHAAGLKTPTVSDWQEVNSKVSRLVSVLPNGPEMHPTVNVFLAGGVPEVMLQLRELGLIDSSLKTVEGSQWNDLLDDWKDSERRIKFREILKDQEGVDPDEVIMNPARARERGLTSTVTFPTGNIAPEGAIIKSTAIDPTVVDEDEIYRMKGPAKVFFSEESAITAIKVGEIVAGDVMVLAGIGPIGTGMEETYQVTSALKFLSFGKHVAVVTDGRFSGVSTGACIGHVGPEALAGGPIGKIQDGDIIQIEIDRNNNRGSLNLVGTEEEEFTAQEGAQVLASRRSRDDLAPHPQLPDDSRLWAALQARSGGTWGGCVYDVNRLIKALED